MNQATKMMFRINWRSFDTMRLLRLFLSIAVMVQGYQDKQGTLVLLGFMFLLMSIFGIGCCSGGSCITRVKEKPFNATNKTEDITYEEVV